MRATILHNPEAGSSRLSGTKLVASLREAGYQTNYQSMNDDDWEKAFKEPADFVVAAGGDGTIGKIVKKLVGEKLPIAIIPLGTANNIARTLGIANLPVSELIESWASSHKGRFDIGLAKTSFHEALFLESVGFGLLTKLISRNPDCIAAQKDPDDQIRAARQAARTFLRTLSPQRLELSLDGQDFSGEYLLMEVINSSFIGPNLDLAGTADPTDQLLDVVLVCKEERRKLDSILKPTRKINDEPISLRHLRVKELNLLWNGFPFHIDDELAPDHFKKILPKPTEIKLSIRSQSVEFLVPAFSQSCKTTFSGKKHN
jgi:diacylglycerol kinase (ATP)